MTRSAFDPHKIAIKNLSRIPGVGKSIAQDLVNTGYHKIEDLVDKDPHKIFDESNKYTGLVQDRCLLYVFRCAVYFAETPKAEREPEKLKWWNWKTI